MVPAVIEMCHMNTAGGHLEINNHVMARFIIINFVSELQHQAEPCEEVDLRCCQVYLK